ncbi:LysR family transcriptional regulator [Gluconacetobacter sacchari DSM 12717]|uniref:LysR family transcriptional regulator n=1 Tax=Gluconacetobacter sacchari DSM 12717 TaxID=1307940 RepID=A0ABQ0PA11_9PROT|nr:LysR family transcriptional regulator [Gluconacetobacter sacchari DSM 12717]
MEEALDISLLSRTTRRVTLTEEGARYYASVVQILRFVDQAGDEARSTRGAAAGTVRISCTAALGTRHISRLIFAFQDRHPEITVDLSLTDERIDLVRDGMDIAIRLGPLADSSMKLHAIGASRRVLVGSTDYLLRHGKPATPEALANLEGIRMLNIAGSDSLALRRADGRTSIVPFGGRLRVDHGLAARALDVASAPRTCGSSTTSWTMASSKSSCRTTNSPPCP